MPRSYRLDAFDTKLINEVMPTINEVKRRKITSVTVLAMVRMVGAAIDSFGAASREGCDPENYTQRVWINACSRSVFPSQSEMEWGRNSSADTQIARSLSSSGASQTAVVPSAMMVKSIRSTEWRRLAGPVVLMETGRLQS